MAKNKKYVYLQLYPKDLMADEKLAKCDKASAWGAYLALLNIMSMENIRGCVRLRDWDSHPNNERKSLVANFRKSNSLRTKAAAFARVVSQCTPLKIGPIAEGIEQLLIFGVVVMHDDALIQPRMFRDSRSVLEGYEPEPEPTEETAAENADNGASISPKNGKKKKEDTPVRTLRANTHTRFKSEHKNNKKNKGVVGDFESPDKRGAALKRGADYKTEEDAPEPAEMPQISTQGSEMGNSTTEGEKRAQKPRKGGNRATVADNPPTLEEVQAYFDEMAAKGKPFRFITPEGFYDACEQSGWRLKDGKPMVSWQARCRTFESYRKEHGDRPIAQRGRTEDSPKHVDNENFDGMETW